MANLLTLLLIAIVSCLACPLPKHSVAFTDTPGNAVSSTSGPHNSSFDRNNGNTSPHHKRWFSIYTEEQLASMGITRPKYSPWPVAHGKRSVRFCFEDEHSHDNLVSTLAHAVALWHAAFRYSTFKIAPDFDCDNDWRCVCGPQPGNKHTSGDALVISDLRTGNDPARWSRGAYSTLGYDRSNRDAGRHVLGFGGLNEFAPGHSLTELQQRKLINDMAHELGHVLGLDHEHQRPDAHIYMATDFAKLKGWGHLKQNIMGLQDPAFLQIPTIDGRMKLCLSDYDLAEQYFPNAADYMPSANRPGAAEWRAHTPEAAGFDFGSIMIYSSDEHMEHPGTPYYPIYKLPAVSIRQPVPASAKIWSGGSPDPHKVSISAQDIKRVAELYPGDAQKQQAARELVQWVGIRVTVPSDERHGSSIITKTLVDKFEVKPAPVDVLWRDAVTGGLTKIPPPSGPVAGGSGDGGDDPSEQVVCEPVP